MHYRHLYIAACVLVMFHSAQGSSLLQSLASRFGGGDGLWHFASSPIEVRFCAQNRITARQIITNDSTDTCRLVFTEKTPEFNQIQIIKIPGRKCEPFMDLLNAPAQTMIHSIMSIHGKPRRAFILRNNAGQWTYDADTTPVDVMQAFKLNMIHQRIAKNAGSTWLDEADSKMVIGQPIEETPLGSIYRNVIESAAERIHGGETQVFVGLPVKTIQP